MHFSPGMIRTAITRRRSAAGVPVDAGCSALGFS